MIDTILLMLIVVGVAVNLAATLWTYRRVIAWIDAVAEMTGEALDKMERRE